MERLTRASLVASAGVLLLAVGIAALAGDPRLRTIDAPEDLHQLERRLIALADTVRPTQVAISVQDVTGGGTCSGTIIDAQAGWILTAGHCFARPGLPVAIELADGRRIPGITAGLVCEGNRDCGLVKFDPVDGLTGAPVGASSALVQGDWLAPFGHTHGWMKDRDAVMRVGRVVRSRDDAIDLDAPLSGGDSGGGVFDLQGRLVGIVSTTAGEPTLGSMCSSDFATGVMDEMKSGAVRGGRSENAAALKALWEGQRGELEPTGDDGRNASELREVLGEVSPVSLQSVCLLSVDNRPVGLATVIDASGVLLAKDSDLGLSSEAIEVTLPIGTLVRATRVARDREMDLVVLRVPGTDLEPVEWAEREPLESGMVAVSASPHWQGESWGIVALDRLREQSLDRHSGFLGIRMRRGVDGGTGLRVEASTLGSPAWVAGIRAGDRIVRVGGQAVEAEGDVGRIARSHGGGELLRIDAERDGEPRSFLLRATVRPDDRRIAQSTALFPASRRASGFGPVLQHDTPLPCTKMGGPLLGLDGRALGINIARPDRTATYAIPASRIRPRLAEWIDAAKSGTVLPPVEPSDAWPPMLREGNQWSGHPAMADLQGSSLVYAFDGQTETGEVVGWTDPLARIAWIGLLEAGVYDLDVEAGLPGKEERTATIDVGIDDAGTRLTVHATPAGDAPQTGRAALDTVTARGIRCNEAGWHLVWVGRPGAADLAIGRVTVRKVDAADDPREDAPQATPP